MKATSPLTKEREDLLYVPLKRARRRPEAIAERIKDFIRDEKLRPGARLPQEKELIGQFKAAKGTVREAMKALETQGLINTRSGPGGGAFVGQLSAQHALELLGNFFFFDQPSLADIYTIRKALEPIVAALLAGKINADDLARLESTIRIYENLPADLDEQYDQRVTELDFHSILAQLCPNPLLGFICGLTQNMLRNLPVARLIYADPEPASRARGVVFQYRLIEALRAGKAEEARQIAYDHMVSAERYMHRKANLIGKKAQKR